MAKLWQVNLFVRYDTEIEAESQEEAEDLAYDEFVDHDDYWDVDIDSSLLWDDIGEEEDDDGYEQDKVDDRSVAS